VKILPERNAVVVGPNEALFTRECLVPGMHWISGEARFGLTQAAKRELDPRKRLLCQIVEHVALVLRLVEGLLRTYFSPSRSMRA